MDPAEELTHDAITRDYRIWQRRRGHRYSLDDLATAHDAVTARPEAAVYADLGCGIGSVLLMGTWKLPEARVWGVEALAQSLALARRSVADNELEDRVTLLHGDLREVTEAWPGPAADLVTGTPPYLPLGTAVVSPDEQRAAARMELRGGVEDYLLGASRILAPEGRVVVCADARRPERVQRGAEAAELVPLRRHDLVPRQGADPLFSVWTLRSHGSADDPATVEQVTTIVRDAQGARTNAAHDLRACFGL